MDTFAVLSRVNESPLVILELVFATYCFTSAGKHGSNVFIVCLVFKMCLIGVGFRDVQAGLCMLIVIIVGEVSSLLPIQ